MRLALATVGTSGDVRPFVALARALVDRGHQVTAVTWPVHGSVFTIPGVRMETAGPHADADRISAVATEASRRGPMEQVATLRDFHLADGEAHYRRLRDLLADHDLVVLHGIHALAHAAVLDIGVPWATAVLDPVLLPTGSAPPPGMPNLGPANRLLWGLLDRVLARAGGPLDALLERAGSRQRGLALFRARSPRLHLVACSPTIIRVPPDLPPTTRVTGAWLDRPPPPALPADLEAFVADGAPPIVITFGSMAGARPEPLRDAIAPMLEGGRRVVLQGRVPLTSPNLATIGSIDHRALFPRAAVVVHHGGAGTTHAACAAGVPSVVVPHVGDQRYWADRLHRLGVAPSAQPVKDLRADRLADATLATAADPTMRQTARDLAARLSREDGLGNAVAAIEGAF
jgi:sterol 3beta-glucosyltransferase/vancomycin aglycone glucosyltransferase